MSNAENLEISAVEGLIERVFPILSDESEDDRLGEILDLLPVAIYMTDRDGHITYFNRKAEMLAGRRPIIGKNRWCVAWRLRNPDGSPLPFDECPMALALKEQRPIRGMEAVAERPDGTRVPVLPFPTPIFDRSGVLVGGINMLVDVTTQTALFRLTDRLHRADTLAEVYEAALDAILEALSCDRASILLFDEAGVMKFVASRGLSDSYCNAVEGHSPWTRDTRDPKPICVCDRDSGELPAALQGIVKAEGIGALAFIPMVSNGKLVGKFMAYYDAPHEFSEAETNLALTIARQLGFSVERMRAETARRLAQESRRESERRLELALTAGRMGAWEWDIATGTVVWSPGLERIHGLAPGTFGGRFDDFTRDVHEDDLTSLLAAVDQALATRSDYHVVYRTKRHDGEIRWLEAFGQPILGADGKPQKLTGVCMDVTERKQAEMQRDLLVAELSHRVKNTLATVIAIARQSFGKSLDAEGAHRSFDSRIRALAQTHGRLAETNWSGVSLETILLDELAPYRGEDHANVSVEGPAVTLNPRCALTLGMAVHELTTNAAKHGALSTKNGSVKVRWRIDQRHRRLRMRWTESGGPPVTSPEHRGFGRLLLERALASDLRGKVRMNFAPDGLRCAIAIPLDENAC